MGPRPSTWFGGYTSLSSALSCAMRMFPFALYSKHATDVTLLLYSGNEYFKPLHEYRLNPLTNKSGRVWHCRLKAAAVSGARYYAYRVAGANEPGAGHRFDDEKILFDPCAGALFRPPHFSREAARIPGTYLFL